MLAFTVFAVFIWIRVAAIRAGNVYGVYGSATFLSAALAGISGFYCDNLKWVLFIAVVAGLLPCVAWSLECIFELPSSSFLRATRLERSYITSLDLQLLATLYGGGIAAACGSLFGVFVFFNKS